MAMEICAMTMHPTDAASLIKDGILKTTRPQQWADLGAGTGVFTTALAAHLSPRSVIHAVDSDAASVGQVKEIVNHVHIKKMVSDFTADLGLINLDGVLIANALHFIEHKIPLLNKMHAMLGEQGRLVIVEYDAHRSNPWVPYPIPFKTLAEQAPQSGFKSISKLGERASRYQNGNLYAALLLASR